MNTIVENTLETVARNLSAARIGMALSQEQLAEAADVSRATIVQIESGAGDPRLSTIAAIAGALNISPMFLLLGRIDMQAIASVANSSEAALMQEHFSEDSIETMQRLLRSGLAKNRNKAINIGTDAASTVTSTGVLLGVTTELSAAAGAGAAIGSVLIPGVGTVIGAALGIILYRNKIKDNK
jgi:DNA-binding XRE family transcriptional regulator